MIKTKNPPSLSLAGSPEALRLLNTNSLQTKYTKKKVRATYLQTNAQLLPHNNEAERNLIVGCLGDPTCVDRSLKFIEPSDFYKWGLRKIFEKLCEFRKQGRTYTPSLVIETFSRTTFCDFASSKRTSNEPE